MNKVKIAKSILAIINNISEQDDTVWKRPFARLWDGTTIYVANGDYVRDHYWVDWTMGGHGYIYDFIPKDEIWFEILPDSKDNYMDLNHEVMEYFMMKYLKMDYDTAHAHVRDVEAILRKAATLELK